MEITLGHGFDLSEMEEYVVGSIQEVKQEILRAFPEFQAIDRLGNNKFGDYLFIPVQQELVSLSKDERDNFFWNVLYSFVRLGTPRNYITCHFELLTLETESVYAI